MLIINSSKLSLWTNQTSVVYQQLVSRNLTVRTYSTYRKFVRRQILYNCHSIQIIKIDNEPAHNSCECFKKSMTVDMTIKSSPTSKLSNNCCKLFLSINLSNANANDLDRGDMFVNDKLASSCWSHQESISTSLRRRASIFSTSASAWWCLD
jgi:hypothetical protein